MKLLWHSNTPGAASGYGGQTAQVGRRLLAAGHDVTFSVNDGVRGDRTWHGAPVLGHGLDQYSRDKIPDDIVRSGAERAVVLFDAWVYSANDPFTIPTAGWVPVDHSPLPGDAIPWLAKHEAIAMSQFGEAALRRASDALRAQTGRGFPVSYIPHAIEPVFRPTPSDWRARHGIPDDAYLVGIVAANTGTAIYDRKGFGDMFLALGEFLDRHPDVWVYVHALTVGQQGMDLTIPAGVAGISDERLVWADQYAIKSIAVSETDMAEAYTAFDVLLATSRGEGFGIPVIEAQACGTPAIVSNWTAQPELVGEVWDPSRVQSYRTPSGWIVEVDPDFDSRHAAMFGKPRISRIIWALEDAYRLRGTDEWDDMTRAALAKAAEYGADVVFERYWLPQLEAWSQGAERQVAAEAKRARRATRQLELVR